MVGHNVVLENWPFPVLKAPSSLGSSLQPLNTLLAALKGSEHHPPTCKWRRLSDDEIFEKNQEFLENVGRNTISHKRKVRENDAGKSKRSRLSDEFVDDDSHGDNDGENAGENDGGEHNSSNN